MIRGSFTYQARQLPDRYAVPYDGTCEEAGFEVLIGFLEAEGPGWTALQHRIFQTQEEVLDFQKRWEALNEELVARGMGIEWPG